MQFRKSRRFAEVLKLRIYCLILQTSPRNRRCVCPFLACSFRVRCIEEACEGCAVAHDEAAVRAEMTALVAELAPNEGMTASLLDGVAFGGSNRSLPRTPVLHDACVVIVCQGRKRGYFGDQVIEYGAHQFMVASVPMPFEGETFATPEEPLLVIKVKLDLA